MFEPGIKSLILDRPISSFSELNAPQFLNVLRVCDVPDLLGLLAPRHIELIDAPPGVVEELAAIYAASGASQELAKRTH